MGSWVFRYQLCSLLDSYICEWSLDRHWNSVDLRRWEVLNQACSCKYDVNICSTSVKYHVIQLKH